MLTCLFHSSWLTHCTSSWLTMLALFAGARFLKKRSMSDTV
jgi:hypothetical protein